MRLPVAAVHAIRFKGCLCHGDLTLRRFRLEDIRALQRLFARHAVGAGAPGGSPIRFWIWLHRTFQWFYTIRLSTRDAAPIIGFIGLYGMAHLRWITLSIALFDPRDRARGYGRTALELLFADWRRREVVRQVRVEVSVENRASLAFFNRLGFERLATGEHVHLLGRGW